MADEQQPVKNDEIESLLRQAQAAGSPPLTAAPSAASSPAASSQTPLSALGGPIGGAQNNPLSQNDVESLLAGSSPASARPAVKAPLASAPPRDETIAAADIELLFEQAREAIASIDAPQSPAAGAKAFSLEEFGGAPPNTERATLELIRDVELDLKIEFGRTQMYLEDVLKLRKGSVVPLDKLAGDPVDIFVNGRLIAKGEVLVLNDNFCVRVAELITAEQST
jgi:flagellar motor switch protein FliN